jgi:DamX protein
MDYFSTPTLSGLIQQLTHLAQFGANVLVVEGERGSGKTALLSQLFENFEALREKHLIFQVSQVLPASDSGLEESVDLLSNSLEMAREDVRPIGERLAEIRSLSQSLLREKKLSLVLVDDAQHLSDEAVAAILSLAIGLGESAYGLRFILFSQPGLAERIDQLGLNELAVYDFSLPGFSSQELERFLSARGVLEGLESKIAHIWNRSQGHPGPALDLVSAMTEKSAAQDIVRDVSRMPILHIGLLAGLIAALILVFLYRGGDDPEITAPARDTLVLPVQESAEDDVPIELAEDSLLIDDPAPDLDSDAPTGKAPQHSEPSLSQSQVDGELESQELLTEEETLAVDDSDLVELVSEPDTQVAVEAESQSVPEERAPTRFERNEEEILEAPAGGFMLQLLAASQVDSLLQYIDSQDNAEDLMLYRRKRSGQKPLYIVVIGPYPSRQAATRAIATLPSQQRDAGPWPKSLSAIKQEILDFRDISQ